MKKAFICFYLMLIVMLLTGQVYHPLIRPNIYWDVAYFVSPAPCYMYLGRTEFIQDDTLVEGHKYTFQKDFPFLGTAGPGGSICPPYMVDTISYRNAFLREDTIEKKVYIYDVDSSPHDQILYDFSLSPGDTFQSDYTTQGGSYVVYSVSDIMLHNGETRKIFCFDPSCIMNYIESIGGCNGLYEPIIMGLGFGSRTLCVKEYGIPVWGSSCNYQFVSIPEHATPYVRLVPNPAHEKLSIEFQRNSGKAVIELLNLYGQLCAKIINQTNMDMIVMDVSNFPPGLYLIRITSEEGIVTTDKVLLTKF